MTLFGIIITMLIVLFIGGYITIFTLMAGMWFDDKWYLLGALGAFITTLFLEWFIFTSNFVVTIT